MPEHKIELHHAYVWDCDSCGRENFCRGIVVELNEEERSEMAEDHGVEDFEVGDWMLAPTQVICSHCGAGYETETGHA